MKKEILIEIISFLLIILFVYAAISKLADIGNFRIQLGRSPLLKGSSTYLAIVLPLAELATAGMLLFHGFRRKGLILSSTLLGLFTMYIIYMLFTEKKLPCSCGGVLRQMTWKQHIVFNVFFLLIALAGIRIENKNRCTT